LDDYERNLSIGEYEAAAPEVTQLAEERDDSQQMWRLLSASANYMADDRPAALRQFDEAEDVFRKNDTTSVFAKAGQGALAMMTNDKAFSYDGGGQDRIFTCIYRFVDFACGGYMDNARVELNRAAQYQANWLYDRRREVSAASDRLEKDVAGYQQSQGTSITRHARETQTRSVLSDSGFAAQLKANCGYDANSSGNLDTLAKSAYMNVYMLHLNGVFRWLNGDSPLNMLRDAADLARGNPVVLRDLAEMSAGAKPENQVWIWVEDGLCPCREEWRIDLPLFLLPYANRYVLYAGMAFPKLRYRQPAASSWTVSAGGAETQLSHLADVDGLVGTEFDVYMRGAVSREIARTIIKVGVQAALGAAAEAAHERDRKKDGMSGDYLTLKLSQAGVAAWARATTAADLRSWTALPKSVKIARVARPPDGKIVLNADAQRIELTVPEGNVMVFVRKPAPMAMPAVKTAVFR
jgi:hypothetical protein